MHSRIFYWKRRKEEDRNIAIQKSVCLFSSQHSIIIIIIIILLVRDSSFSNYFSLFLSIVGREHPDKGTVSASFFLIIKKQCYTHNSNVHVIFSSMKRIKSSTRAVGD